MDRLQVLSPLSKKYNRSGTGFPYRHLVNHGNASGLDVVAPGIYSKYTLLYG